MKSFAAILLLASTPLLTQATNFRIRVRSSDGTAAPYNNKYINAANSHFVVGSPSVRAPCGGKDMFGSTCTPLNNAFFLPVRGIDNPDDNVPDDPLKNINQTLHLDTYQPVFRKYDGQQAYINSQTGAFRFAAPADNPPAGSVKTGFQGGGFGTVNVLNPDRSGQPLASYVCPNANGNGYGVYFKLNGVKLAKSCSEIVMLYGGGVYGAKKYI